jgi:hypothetical protein
MNLIELRQDTIHFTLIIADCHRRIMLDFALTSVYLRKRNLAKLDRLVRVINEFSEAVHAEAKLIENDTKINLAPRRSWARELEGREA